MMTANVLDPNSLTFPLIYGIDMIVVLVLIAVIAVWFIER